MPAARMGWIIINDRNNQLVEIRKGLMNITGRNFWPNSTLTRALPDILKNVPQKFFDDNSKAVHVRLFHLYAALQQNFIFFLNLCRVMPSQRTKSYRLVMD